MPVDLVIVPEADLDIAEAYGWYEGRAFGMGEQFLASVDACVEGIRRRPEMLLKAADLVAKRRRLNRSALIRQALQEHLKRLHVLDLEERDRRGYQACRNA